MGVVQSAPNTPADAATDRWTAGDPLVLAPAKVDEKELEKKKKEEEEAFAERTTRTHVIALCRANNKFGITVLQAMLSKRQGNVIFSPLDLAVGLGKLCIGSDSTTREEFRKALFLAEVEPKHRLPAFAAVYWDTLRTTAPKGCEIQAASRVFVQKEFQMATAYRETCTKYEMAQVKYVDFKRADSTRAEINEYVAEKTLRKITNVLPVGLLDQEIKMLIVAAIYIRSKWNLPFEISKTYTAKFSTGGREKIDVNMMNTVSVFRAGYTTKLDADVVEIPWAIDHVRMVILLPRKPDQLPRLEAKLTRSMLENLEGQLHPELLDLHIPRIRYELGFNANEPIQKAGIKDLFVAGKADLSLMDGGKGLYLTKIFHHICLIVDEGQEDKTVSTPTFGRSSSVGSSAPASSAERVFKVDRPFIFLVRDYRTRAIIVLGRVVRPNT
ncbi:unnamed protein product [Dimorphilus gyrociliatus]|uniref:Serpin domain-containing protein n=1 Tax=Dimorphilus gyrociliatus TaxID=2664684 RepID=A0A7I8VG64_9ANNE|nr:unnamed protein product [Dimorphilus gyrociliatus]